MFENEEWRSIADLPHYSVSSLGRVKKNDSPNARSVTISDKGFPIVTLYGADSKTRYLKHINMLVARAFLPPPVFDNMTAVWHIDGDLTNCRADNLKWEMRSRVLEWNEMHRRGTPKFETPMVVNNRTGVTYRNAFECGMAEGEIESSIIWKVERQAASMDDKNARYRYTY
jgi:hypothetical protein